MSVIPLWLRQPVRLSPDNFTSLARTPWAGRVIGEKYKREVVPAAVGQPIGESWEFSCDPDFPSRLADHEMTLQSLFDRYPAATLGLQDDCAILVKLLNPAEPLSLQVHPTDDDPRLATGECGKPESWLVLAADEGAGIYLGFARSLSRDQLRYELAACHDLRPLLQFVPVQAGDYFEIQPGVVHALGAGVTLLEPQRITPGLSGKTYRFWDWGRLYDQDGMPSAVGTPRPLHWQQALQLVDPLIQTGESFVDSLRRRAVARLENTSLRWLVFPANPYYQVHRFEGSSFVCRLDLKECFAALVVLEGEACFGTTALRGGESALLPAACFPLAISSHRDCEFMIVHPASLADQLMVTDLTSV